MTEIEHVPHANHLPARPAHTTPGLPALGAGVAALQQWAETAHAAGSLIASIVDTPFFPAALMPRLTGSSDEALAKQRAGAIANGTGAVLSGVEIGLSPMQALNNVIVIHGRPSLYAETMVALVQAAGHQIWTEESTETRAVVCGQRAGSDHVERAEFTMARARKAGYAARNKKYDEDPVAMLYARAASIACRRTAPEVLKGIAAFEEVTDDGQGGRPGAPPVPPVPVTVAEITGTAERVPVAPPAELPLGERIDRLVDWYAGKHGVPAEALAARVGRPQTEWTEDDVAQLRDIGALLSRGQIAVSDEFNLPEDDGPVDAELVDDPAAAAPAPGGITESQRRRLFAMLGDLQVVDRDARLRMAARLLNLPAPLGSFNDLTAEQADEVAVELAQLTGLPEAEGRAQAALIAAEDDAP